MKKHVTTKYTGKSFADTSKLISQKYKNRDLNKHDQNSYLAEMRELMTHQEKQKLAEQIMSSIKDYRKPANASKYAKGGMLPKYDGLTEPNNMLPDSTKINNDNVLGLTNSMMGGNSYNPLPMLYAQPGGKPDINSIGKGTNNASGDTSNWFKDNIYAPVALGKGLEFAGKLAMLASGYDKVNPEYNPYESEIRSRMSQRKIDLGQIEQNINTNINQGLDNTSNVRSEAVRQNLNQGLFSNAQKNLADTSLQEQQARNQYSAEYASTLDALGQQRVGANRYAEQLNQQAKGNYQLGLQGALETVGNAGQKLTDYRANVAQQRILGSILQTNDFQMGDAKELITKAQSGEKLTLDDFIQLANSKGKDVNTATQMFLEYKKKILQ
jgi:hypothetical protein